MKYETRHKTHCCDKYESDIFANDSFCSLCGERYVGRIGSRCWEEPGRWVRKRWWHWFIGHYTWTPIWELKEQQEQPNETE